MWSSAVLTGATSAGGLRVGERLAGDVDRRLLASVTPADDFAMELRSAPRAGNDLTAAVKPIARLIRRMQVSHLFGDRAEPVDTVILLNYLLAAGGLPPSIIDDPSMFGGREPIDELTAEIIKGQKRYQMLMHELVTRDPPPMGLAHAAASPGAPTPR